MNENDNRNHKKGRKGMMMMEKYSAFTDGVCLSVMSTIERVVRGL